jgi:ketosteroid isomerase-like protein
VYHQIVQRNLRRAFQNVSTGNFDAVFPEFAPTIQHTFAGDNTFGGTRHDLKMVQRWYQRLHHVFPNLHLEVEDVLVKGMPWDTTATVRWTESATLPNGEIYRNKGMHYIKIRWFRVVLMDIYLDTQAAANVLAELGQHGVTEAIAPQIVGVAT